MKKYIAKSFLVVMALLVSTLTFAQDPGDVGDPADPNPTDTPIGDYIWVLGVIALVYVFFKMKSRIQSSVN